MALCCSQIVLAEPIIDVKYSCEIPKSLDKKIILHEKDKHSTEGSDAHTIYKDYHSEGWYGLITHYLETGNTNYSPVIAQEWGIMTTARYIGISEARTLILKSKLIHGSEKLEVALKKFYNKKTK